MDRQQQFMVRRPGKLKLWEKFKDWLESGDAEIEAKIRKETEDVKPFYGEDGK